MRVLAVDPGTEKSAWVVWDGKAIGGMDISNNQDLVENLKYRHRPGFGSYDIDGFVIEKIMSYGMKVSTSIFDTVFWTGRFCQAWGGEFFRVPRMDVKMHLCHSSRAKDSNIRQALIDRFGPPGTKKNKGLTYGLRKDLWQAFAVAIYWIDLHGEVEK